MAPKQKSIFLPFFLLKAIFTSQTGWLRAIIPEVGVLSQEDYYDFKTNLNYRVEMTFMVGRNILKCDSLLK